MKQLADGSRAVALLNRSATEAEKVRQLARYRLSRTSLRERARLVGQERFGQDDWEFLHCGPQSFSRHDQD